MYDKNKIVTRIKSLIRKDMMAKEIISNDIENEIKDIKIESIGNIEQSEIINEKLKVSLENMEFKAEIVDNTRSIDKNEEYKIENRIVERVNSDMDNMKIRVSNPCDITNKLTQAIMKIPKHLITQEQLDNVGVTINLGHINEYQVLDVTFKHNQEIDNPCGNGTIMGEVLLKAVVLVGSVEYSWILYDKITKSIVYDGVKDEITAYSVYDIIPFDENKRPTDVTATFTTTLFERLPDDPTLDYYLYKVEGTTDLLGV